MAQRILEVTLISATDLKDVNLFSKMEVYAVVSLSGDPRTRQRTPADRSGGRNPRWNATLRFAVPDSGAAVAVAGDLRVLLRTERALGDRDVGEVRVPLKELLGAGDAPRVVSYRVRKIGSGKPRGLLNLSYKLGERIAAPAAAAAEPVTAYPAAPPYGYAPPPYRPAPGQYGYPPAAPPYGYRRRGTGRRRSGRGGTIWGWGSGRGSSAGPSGGSSSAT